MLPLIENFTSEIFFLKSGEVYLYTLSSCPALVLMAPRPGWTSGLSPLVGMLRDWMRCSGRHWGAQLTWFTGRAAGLPRRRLAAVPRHYNRSSTSGSEESVQAHITSSPPSPSHPLPSPASPTQQCAPAHFPSSSPAPLKHCEAGGEACNNSSSVMRATGHLRCTYKRMREYSRRHTCAHRHRYACHT